MSTAFKNWHSLALAAVLYAVNVFLLSIGNDMISKSTQSLEGWVILVVSGYQHPVRELSRSHRPLQDLHRRSYRIRYRLLPSVQRRSTATNNPDPSSRSYFDRRWRHLLGGDPGRRSSCFRKTQKVAAVYKNSIPSFFLTL